MRRRQFILLLGAGAAAWPIAARAQQPAMPVVSFLRNTSFDDTASDFAAAFGQGLSEAGYVDGQNVTIEVRSAEGSNDRLVAEVADLVRRQVAVIVGNAASALAAKTATTRIPIVFATGGDPVRNGLVASLRRPGGNITGVSFLNATLSSKQLELLRELIPNVTTIGFIADTTVAVGAAAVADARAAARAMGIRVIVVNASSERDIDAAFSTLVQQQARAIMASGAAPFSNRRHQFAALAAQHALPAVYESRQFVTAGGLMSYGSNIPDAYRQAGVYAGRILSGANPADLPVVQSTRVDLVINLRTASALGLTIPPNLLSRADEVIE